MRFSPGARTRLDDESGVTLVELLVAIMLLGLIMGAMARSITASLFTLQGQERQVHATSLVREQLEAARGLVWTQLGLCEDDIDDSDAFVGGSYTYPDGTEEVVVRLSMSHDVCDPVADAPLRPERTITRNDVDYEVLTVVSWADDELDGTVAAGTDTDGDDLKHVYVEATWTHRGETRTTVSETYVSEHAVVANITTAVEHRNPADAEATYTYLNMYDGTGDDDGLTQSEVVLHASATTPQSGIVVRWLDADGNYITPRPMSSSDNGLTFTLLIPEGSPDFAVNRLANGETVFEFTATDAASGTKTVVFDRGLFLIERDGVGVDDASVVLSDADGLPAAFRVDESGALCEPLFLSLFADGLLRSDFVTAVWTDGIARQELVADEGGSDHRGSRFGEEVQGPVELVEQETGPEPPAEVTVSFYLQRNGDSYTVGEDPATTTLTSWEPSVTFTVEVGC